MVVSVQVSNTDPLLLQLFTHSGIFQFPSTSCPGVAAFVSWTVVSSVFIRGVKLLPLAVTMVGASLSEPHTSGTALQKCVCKVRACLWP